jgi:hypothetical protein
MARLFVLLLVCAFASGCGLFDEIDAYTSEPAKTQPTAPGATPAANAGAAPAGAPGPPAGEAWWATAKSLDGRPAGEGDGAVISCRVGKATRFMRRGDCLSQGGVPKS